MSGTSFPAEDADDIWRGWMTGLLSAAAEHFDLAVAGSLAWGWRDRSVGASAAGTDGPRWLRVVTEDVRWAHGAGAVVAGSSAGHWTPWRPPRPAANASIRAS
jgi:hypothetical protein